MLLQSSKPLNSVAIYDSFWICWKLVGISTGFNAQLCGLYDLLLNIFITICYPLHLSIGLFMGAPSQGDIFKNLAINITCIVCSLKHYLLRYKLSKIRKMQQLLAQLDKRAMAADERHYFESAPKAEAISMVRAFVLAYAGANIAAALGVLLRAERRLMYPAWFPFDWQSSSWKYWLALTYQIVGVSVQIIQNMANDIYAPMSLCILAGHVRLLCMRVVKIGRQAKQLPAETEQDLVACIEDHKKLLHIFALLQDTISYAQLAQFISSGTIICVSLVYLLFYADDYLSVVYFSVYFVAMVIELFPCCYYGSILQQEFEDLPYSLFVSNWQPQSRRFHQNQRIFTQQALKQITPLAGGTIGINLNAFFGTCKMAYSLYAVIMRVKEI